MTQTVDVAIIGGGIAGVSLAYRLAPHRSVVVLERESALGYHATGRSAAEFTLRFHSPLAGALTLAGRAFMENPPPGFASVPLLRPRGNLIVADADKTGRLHAAFAAETANPPAGASPLTLLDVEAALERAPFLNPDWLAAAFYDPDCWDVDVDALLQGFARGAKAAGAQIRTCAEAQRIAHDGARWRIETAEDTLHAAMLVNAAGAWADGAAAIAGVPPVGITPYRRTMIAVGAAGYDLSAAPEINEIDEAFYLKPDVGRLLACPCDETPCAAYDAWPEEMDIAEAAWRMTEATRIPVARAPQAWAGLRSFAPDRAPVVGFSSHAPGFFWLAGQGGFGIQTAAGLSDLAARRILGDVPDASTCAMDPARLGG